MLPRVRVTNKANEIFPTHIYINDTELQGVKSLEYFKLSVDEIPTFRFTTIGLPEIEIGQARIEFEFTPRTIEDAAIVIRDSLVENKELYDAFLASIRSVLEESHDDMAKAVADRIIGL